MKGASIPPPGAPALKTQASREKDRLVPLPHALEMIAAQIYQEHGASVRPRRTELFDALACTVSALVPIFVVDSQAARPLSEEVVDSSLFRKGGSEMYFVDGRPPIYDLAVTLDGVSKVIGILKGSSQQS